MGILVKLALLLVVAYALVPESSSYAFRGDKMELMFTEDQIFDNCNRDCETSNLSPRAMENPAVQRALYHYGCFTIGNCRTHRPPFQLWLPKCSYCYCECSHN